MLCRVPLPDGLYAVRTPHMLAGFIVRGGHVDTTRTPLGVPRDCAPILVRRLTYWATRALGPL